jgi:hypothetical protein
LQVMLEVHRILPPRAYARVFKPALPRGEGVVKRKLLAYWRP